jgi:hypothetical protein
MVGIYVKTGAIVIQQRLVMFLAQATFFAMLRSWHNNRALEDIWSSMDIVLVISTETHILIDNLNQSPFNVGTTITLGSVDILQKWAKVSS